MNGFNAVLKNIMTTLVLKPEGKMIFYIHILDSNAAVSGDN
jgi:hypothetical protein